VWAVSRLVGKPSQVVAKAGLMACLASVSWSLGLLSSRRACSQVVAKAGCLLFAGHLVGSLESVSWSLRARKWRDCERIAGFLTVEAFSGSFSTFSAIDTPAGDGRMS
jgi:hypothetical protein